MKRLLATMLLTWGLAPAPGAAADWRVMQPESRIGFVATYDDIPFEARFDSFDARIRFAEDRLDESSFDIRIDMASVDSNSRDRDQGMKQQEWFAVERFPEARFRADRFERLPDGRFEAVGTLTVKDVARRITVPFTWQRRSDGEALLTAETELSRLSFNIGTGEWEEDDTIGFRVKVEARLVLAAQ